MLLNIYSLYVYSSAEREIDTHREYIYDTDHCSGLSTNYRVLHSNLRLEVALVPHEGEELRVGVGDGAHELEVVARVRAEAVCAVRVPLERRVPVGSGGVPLCVLRLGAAVPLHKRVAAPRHAAEALANGGDAALRVVQQVLIPEEDRGEGRARVRAVPLRPEVGERCERRALLAPAGDVLRDGEARARVDRCT